MVKGRSSRKRSSRRHLTGNLPLPLTPLVGRFREAAEVKRLLREVRLLTLTGTGGTGKTRLALHVAGKLQATYPDGTWWIELSGLTDAALIPAAVAHILGVRGRSGQSLTEAIGDYAESRRLLLILDTCEHLTDGVASFVATLLRSASGLRIMATSREPLRVPGETTYHVPPLQVPQISDETSLEGIAGADAVRLFVERTRAVNPAFRLTAEIAGEVVRICRRLDGLPLAIELAAARTRAFSLGEISRRLGDSLALLSSDTTRASRPRHQTLRAAIGWSYTLLTDAERVVFRRLGVFAGPFTLDAAEAVCSDRLQQAADVDATEVTAAVGQLVDKSLLIMDAEPGEPAWYRMLDTIRQYAAERLDEAAEVAPSRGRHLEHYLALAEQAAPALRGAEQRIWLRRLLREQDNIRTALAWAATSGDGPALLRMTSSLWRFWNVEGLWQEGREWLERALSADPTTPDEVRARALFGVGVLSWWQRDRAAARRWLDEARRLAEELGERAILADSLRQLGLVAADHQEFTEAWGLAARSLSLFEEIHDPWGIAAASRLLGFMASGRSSWRFTDRLDLPLASRYFERSLELARELGDARGIGITLDGLALVMLEAGELVRARELAEEARRVLEDLNDRAQTADAVLTLGRLAWMEGDLQRAQRLAAESLALAREVGDLGGESPALRLAAAVARDQGDLDRAESLEREALSIYTRHGNAGGIAGCLEGLGHTACRRRRWKDAATLLAAATATRARFRIILLPSGREAYARSVGIARAALGEATFQGLWNAGLEMTLEQAVAYGTTPAQRARVTANGRKTAEGSVALTAREREVAALVARGFSNREIAEALVISRRTADSHIQHILNKLGFRSRAQIAAWAVASGVTPQ